MVAAVAVVVAAAAVAATFVAVAVEEAGKDGDESVRETRADSPGGGLTETKAEAAVVAFAVVKTGTKASSSVNIKRQK